MKYLILIVSVLLLVAGCAGMTASVWDERDGGLGARVGVDMNNTEIGASVLYWPDGENENSEVFGAYGIYKFPDLVEIPNPLKLDFLPETLSGTPYSGYRIDIDGERSRFIAGVEVNNTVFFEYQETYITAGLKRKF